MAGYTHYWEVKEPLLDPEWWEICRCIRLACTLVEHAGISITGEESQNSEPIITNEIIAFNGTGDDGHESFVLERKATDFEFCKTAEKPYDVLVVAALVIASRLAPQLSWSSDGKEEDHEAGSNLADLAMRLSWDLDDLDLA